MAMLGYLGVLLLAESFDAIIATSTAAERTLRAIFADVGAFVNRRLGSVCSKNIPIHRIPLAVDDAFLAPRARRDAREALRLPTDRSIVMYLGRLSETFKADLWP